MIRGKMIKLLILLSIVSMRPHACGFLGFELHRMTSVEKSTLDDEHEDLLHRPPVMLDDYPFDEDENYDMGTILEFIDAGQGGHVNWNYSSLEELLLLDQHNKYRGNMSEPVPFMSNINYVEWDPELARLSGAIAGACWHDSALPDLDGHTVSQNLYLGASTLATRPIWKWYEQYRHYDFAERECHGECHHYENMAFYSNIRVGCARAQCAPRDEMFMAVCVYHPKPSKKDEMFHHGEPCNQCERGEGGLCHEQLCVTQELCRTANLTCECRQRCKNCAQFNSTTCSCDCFPGWDSGDCGEPCRDLDPLCGKIGGIPRRECYQDEDVRNHKCRAFCHQCRKMKRSMRVSELCCGGKRCNPGNSLDEKTCGCVLDCPGRFCMFNETPVFAQSGPKGGAGTGEAPATSGHHLLQVVAAAVALALLFSHLLSLTN